MATKLTKRDHFNTLLAMVEGNDELTAFLNHEIELLDKRSSADRKPTPKEKAKIAEDNALAEALLEGLAGNALTVSQVVKTIPAFEGFSSQKVTAIMRKLIALGKITRSEVKGVAYFALAE